MERKSEPEANRGWTRGVITAVVLTLALWVGACAEEGVDTYGEIDLRDSPLSTRPGARVIATPEWETVFQIGGDETDTTLYLPYFLAGGDEGLYVYDGGRRQVLRISPAGDVDWVFGGRGRGPDEFIAVRDIELDARGHLWILDPDNSRVTILTPDGEVEARIPLGEIPRAEQVIPVSKERALLVTIHDKRPLLLIDRSGRVVDRLAVPWKGYRRMNPMATQMLGAADPTGEYFVVAFRAGDGFFVFKDGEPMPYYGVFVEHIGFPAVTYFDDGETRTTQVDRSPGSAASLAIRDGRLLVHFAGETEDALALVDIYRLDTGEYERTIRLPRWLAAAALGDGVIYGRYSDPYPTLVAWRPVGEGIVK